VRGNTDDKAESVSTSRILRKHSALILISLLLAHTEKQLVLHPQPAGRVLWESWLPSAQQLVGAQPTTIKPLPALSPFEIDLAYRCVEVGQAVSRGHLDWVRGEAFAQGASSAAWATHTWWERSRAAGLPAVTPL